MLPHYLGVCGALFFGSHDLLDAKLFSYFNLAYVSLVDCLLIMEFNNREYIHVIRHTSGSTNYIFYSESNNVLQIQNCSK